MRKPTESIEIFKKRRQKALSQLGSKALIVAAHPESPGLKSLLSNGL